MKSRVCLALLALAFVIAAAPATGLIGSPAAAQSNYDCAHGPDFYRVRNVESWDRLNIRSGPGVSNPVISSMPPQGVGVQCIGPCSGNWCRISWQGVVGWVNMRYLGE